MSSNILLSGTSEIDITPRVSLQLAGYPFVERLSTGTHDPLLASVIYLTDGVAAVVFVSCDLIFIGAETARSIREQLQPLHNIPVENIMISATHTHSGPSTVSFVAGAHDEALQPVSVEYLTFLERQVVAAVGAAIAAAVPAEIGFSEVDVSGIGTNRHDPEGPADLASMLMVVRRKADAGLMGCMIICSMHPTVLHEDSTLYSGDFPGLARSIIKRQFLSEKVPFLFQMGTSGNQSPRHATAANTFEEAERLAGVLADAIGSSLSAIGFRSNVVLKCGRTTISLVRKSFPEPAAAAAYVAECCGELASLRDTGAAPQKIRSAEVNWFGAKELQHLATVNASGQLENVWRQVEQVDILAFKIGDHCIVGWPGEVFVEYGLAIKKQFKNSAVITLVNGELQGYIVTQAAVDRKVYEASNSIFSPESGDRLVAATARLLNDL